ncbi:TlpA disulfide reductase family protein [Pseudonocardia alaniniphila]
MTGTHVIRRRRSLVHRGGLCVAAALLLIGCGTGTDAVAVGDSFEFVAPGGQTTIFYDPPASRGRAGEMSAKSVTEPGERISLSDFAGQVVVVNIWGSWCGPCREEAPALQEVHDIARPSGVTVLGVAVRDDQQAAADFMRNWNLTYPSLFDQPGRTLAAFRGFPRNTIPSTLVLDRSHRVAAVFLTTVRASELLSVVQRVASEPA